MPTAAVAGRPSLAADAFLAAAFIAVEGGRERRRRGGLRGSPEAVLAAGISRSTTIAREGRSDPGAPGTSGACQAAAVL